MKASDGSMQEVESVTSPIAGADTHCFWASNGSLQEAMPGSRGEVGPQGETGTKGEQGPKGDTGERGPTGDVGAQGETGPKGDTGETGLTGPKGDTGDSGPQGERGPPGETGPKGDTGDQGPIGLTGPKGDTGEPGPSRRIETYSGSTNASGIYTVTYATAFPSVPHVDLSYPGASTEQFVRLVSSTTTGFTAHAYARGGLTVLSVTLLALATTNVNGATIRAVVTAA